MSLYWFMIKDAHIGVCVCFNKNTWAYLKKSISYWKTKYQQCVGRIQSSAFITQVIKYDIACSYFLTAAKHKSGFIFTTDNPHGRALGVLWGIRGKWPHYNGTSLYYLATSEVTLKYPPIVPCDHHFVQNALLYREAWNTGKQNPFVPWMIAARRKLYNQSWRIYNSM